MIITSKIFYKKFNLIHFWELEIGQKKKMNLFYKKGKNLDQTWWLSEENIKSDQLNFMKYLSQDENNDDEYFQEND